jgi:hypothetical protein
LLAKISVESFFSFGRLVGFLLCVVDHCGVILANPTAMLQRTVTRAAPAFARMLSASSSSQPVVKVDINWTVLALSNKNSFFFVGSFIPLPYMVLPNLLAHIAKRLLM